VDVSSAALRKRLPFLGGSLGLLGLWGGGEMFLRIWDQGYWPPPRLDDESRHYFTAYLFLFVLGIAVAFVSLRSASRRIYLTLFASSGVLLLFRRGLPDLGAPILTGHPHIAWLRGVLDPVIVIAAWALWGCALAHLGSPLADRSQRLGRQSAMAAMIFLGLKVIVLAMLLQYLIGRGVPSGSWIHSMAEEAFPQNLPNVFLVWGCIEGVLDISGAAEDSRRWRRVHLALFGWFCAHLFLWTYAELRRKLQEDGPGPIAVRLLIPFSLFAVQTLAGAVLAALAFGEPETPKSPTTVAPT
jgi:hypothetical protein